VSEIENIVVFANVDVHNFVFTADPIKINAYYQVNQRTVVCVWLRIVCKLTEKDVLFKKADYETNL